MDLDHRRIAANMTDALRLERAPVALAFCAAPPEGVAVSAAVVPSACAFWREAEAGVFFAPASLHANCPIGAFVLGFELGADTRAELEGLIGRMTGCGYVGADEPAHIPTMKRRSAGILYGPLAAFPAAPDAVLLWLAPDQAMIWNEAANGASWSGAPAPVYGRPACAAVPKALAGGAPALSLGCIGMRTFTGIAGERMLGVVPGSRLAEFAASLAKTAGVNRAMQSFYEERRARLPAR